jgi:hypothetical protein
MPEKRRMISIPALRRWLIAIVAAAICLVSPASAATIRLALDKGRSFTWEWKIFRSIETAGKPKQSNESTTAVTLRVIERTRDGYLLELQNGKTLFDPALQEGIKGDAAIAELLKFLETLKVRFLVTWNGEIRDVVNFDDVKAAAQRIIEVAAQDGVADRAVLQKAFAQITASKEQLKLLALKDAELLFYGTNTDPRMKIPVEFETELPNVFGGQPLKASGRLSLKGTDQKNRTAEYLVEQEVDKDSLVQMMKDLGTKVGKEPPKDVLENMMRDGSIRDTIDVTVALDSGLSIHAAKLRTSVIASTTRVDRVELSLQK